MDDSPEAIASRLRLLKARLDITNAQLQALAGTKHRQSVSFWLKTGRIPRERLRLIARNAGIDPYELEFGHPRPPPRETMYSSIQAKTEVARMFDLLPVEQQQAVLQMMTAMVRAYGPIAIEQKKLAEMSGAAPAMRIAKRA